MWESKHVPIGANQSIIDLHCETFHVNVLLANHVPFLVNDDIATRIINGTHSMIRW